VVRVYAGSMSSHTKLWGYGMAAAGATLFSTKAIFIKLAFREEVNATLMLAWRMIFSLPFFIGVGVWMVLRMRRAGQALPSPRAVWMSALTGFLGYGLSSFFDFKGLEFISAQLERLVLFTYPLFIMFIGAAWFRQPLTRYGIIACIITYMGLGIVVGIDLPEGGTATLIGVALVLACAVTFAVNQLMAKNLIGVVGPILFTSISMIAGGAASILLQLVAQGTFAASSGFLWQTLGCAIFATVLPIFCINAGLSRISAQSVGMISTLSPIVTIALAVYLLGEPFTPADALGSLLVLAGVSYYTWADRRSKEHPAPVDNEVTG
jgi:drug/metabolite transporter (DMT)-like permease